ncbi:GntR family transcriptional regulator [Roseospira goensis]|uniref:DNA-binding GntR family transcriptional regulator n=1 Tax=Roseospira goensis TaxID=391922 RepID=A0A7W6S1W5_9PROT|nr:GntR family transcriptional regulator [Roseospira goensis]MBB4287378.1 DNA-binding GntR family transcriptional regulator [Roseospira goensis]
MSSEQQTLAEKAFESIYAMIMSGALPLGGIVNEVALSHTLEIGRGPVREAVQRLQGLRLVTREPYMRARVVSLSVRDMVEIFQLREAAEGMAARLAATHMSDAEIAALIERFERRRAGLPGPDGETPDVFDVHVRIAEGSGNSRIRHLLCEELYHLLRLYRRRSGALPGRRGEALDEHWQILRALQIRDPALAESLMRSHISRATELLLATLPDQAPRRADNTAA